MIKAEIPLKLPSLNTYINQCRYNRYSANNFKQKTQNDIAPYLLSIPKLKCVKIHFRWFEGNKKRDLDGICFAKKFILDTLVNLGKLEDDNRKYVCGFTDEFYYSNTWKVVLEIEEIENE